jgi:hypothetical protein
MSTTSFRARRHALKASLGLMTGFLFLRPATSRAANLDAAGPKLDRELAKYQDAPGPGGHHCANCMNFVAPNHCLVLNGEISPGGHCLSYAPR